MGKLGMTRLVVAGGAMPLKSVKALRAWMMLLVLALPLTLTAPMASTINLDEFTVHDISEAIKAQENGDYETALKIWRSLADQGHDFAQYNLGVMYANGEGVERDVQEAARLYHLAAGQGYADAQYNLALMYSNGDGVEQDVKEAARLYRLAANQGDASAQHNLAVMYSIGEGVFQDLEKSYMWFALAALNGVEEAPKGRDLVKQEMLSDSSLGPAAVKQAEKAARRCHDSNYQDCGS